MLVYDRGLGLGFGVGGLPELLVGFATAAAHGISAFGGGIEEVVGKWMGEARWGEGHAHCPPQRA